jgi:hypothetical protein
LFDEQLVLLGYVRLPISIRIAGGVSVRSVLLVGDLEGRGLEQLAWHTVDVAARPGVER